MKLFRSFAIVIFFFIIFFFLLTTFLYFNDKFYASANKIAKENPYFQKPLGYLDSFYNEIDIYKFLFKKNLDEEEIISLKLSGSDVREISEKAKLFKKVGYIKDELNGWKKAKIFIDNKEEKIKFKFHGTSISPLTNFNAFSLRIKHNKEGNYLDSMREYSLLSYNDDLDISTISINRIASKYGLLSPHGRMVISKINNIPIGMFMLVEHFEKEWFEKNKMTNYSILKSNDDWDRKENTSGTAHISDFDNSINNKEIKSTSTNPDLALGALNNLFIAIENKDLRNIKKYIDIDYASKFMALNVLANNAHPFIGDNFKYIYDHTSGKFKFLFRVEDTINEISDSIEEFNSSLFSSYPVSSSNLDLFKILTMDPDFRSLRDKHLYKLYQQKEEILLNANEVFNKNFKVLMNSNHSLRKYLYNKKKYLDKLNSNFEKIKKYLNYTKLFVTIDISQPGINKISIANDSFVPIKLLRVSEEINVKKDIQKKSNFSIINLNSPSLNTYLNQNKSFTEFELKVQSNIKKLVFTNSITGELIPDKDTYLNYTSELENFSDFQLIEEIKSNDISFQIKDDNLIINEGVYEIKNNLVFPKFKKITFSPGVKFLMAPNKSILIQSDFFAEGSIEKPIVVKRANINKKFGVFAVIGSDAAVKVNLKFFKIDGGSEASIRGIDFLGQLSIHNSILKMDNISVINSLSDDGINVRNSKVDIKNSSFQGNLADQIDLDFCQGTLSDNFFKHHLNEKNKENDSNGDGLDLSGSKIFVEKNFFEGFLDKAMSVGENSNVYIAGNSFKNNFRAIAVKDGSKAFIERNIFLKNKIDLSLYVKKKFYEQPKIYFSTKIDTLLIDNQLKDKVNAINLISDEQLLLKYESK